MRVQMVKAFQLSIRTNETQLSNNEPPLKKKEIAWWEAGQIILYPESKVGLLWGFVKTMVILISLFTFTYSAAFIFEQQEMFRQVELFFDFV